MLVHVELKGLEIEEISGVVLTLLGAEHKAINCAKFQEMGIRLCTIQPKNIKVVAGAVSKFGF